LIYDLVAPFEAEIDGLQRCESLETLTQALQPLICDFRAPCKVKVDGLQ